MAVLDSGVDCAHPDLAASCVNGWNFFENNSNTDDVYGHGTKVAGAAMAIGNNAVGVAGVAPKTKVMPIRIAGTDGYGSVTAMLQGMTYAADHGARVANLSFGYICGYQSLLNAANYMRGKGGVATFAAGNYNSDDGSAPSTSVTCVSATGSTDVKASWSSFGNAVDVATPGVGIQTTVKGGSYGSVSGTSIASPVTAGIYALMFSVNPKLTPAEADSILFQTADDLGTVGWDMYYGHGRVNAARAVALAASTTGSLGDIDRTAPSTPVNLSATAITGTSVTLTWTPSTDNVAVTGYNVYRNGVKIGTSASTMYTDTTVKGDTTYTYTVAAYDKEVNISAQSSSVTVVTPSAPLAIVSSSVSVKGATSAAITVATSKVATITIRYGTTATNLSLSVTGSGAATSQTMTLAGLKGKTKYFYQVVATTGTETVTGAVSNFRTAAK